LFAFKNRFFEPPQQASILARLEKILTTRLKKYINQDNLDKYRDRYQYFKSAGGKLVRQFKRPEFPQNNEKTYLHLGCGNINHPSFINIDKIPYAHVHYVRSIDNLKIFPSNTVSLVYASHCLEHFSHKYVHKVLEEWFRVLNHNGILRLSVPNFDLLLKIYLENNCQIETIMKPLLGGQENPFDLHMVAFTEKYLTELLLDIGFFSVKQWQPGTSALTDFDDWSSRIVVINGKAYPVSLNLEAIKK
jgi:predicted SAM-dependent methyltransferase